MIKKLKERRGNGYIDVVVIIIIISISLMLILKLFPVFVMKNKMDNYASGVSRILSVEGNYDTYVENKIEEYSEKTDIGKLELDLEETSFIPGTKRIQLNEQIVVKVTATYDMSFWQFTSIPITLHAKSISQSEVYWK